MSDTNKLIELRREEYDLRLAVNRLQHEIHEDAKSVPSEQQMIELRQTQEKLNEVQRKLSEAESKASNRGEFVESQISQSGANTRTTQGLQLRVFPRMAHVPTATYHLLDPTLHPLIECELVTSARAENGQRFCIESYIEEYSARAVSTVELDRNDKRNVLQQPTLFPEKIELVRELTRATLHLIVRDLSEGGNIHLHQTNPIWLLARNSAPLAVRDPSTGAWTDLSRYFGAFVTPNEQSVMRFQRQVAEHHPEGRLVGYQGPVMPQARAIFDALKNVAKITYVNSLVDFNPEEGAQTQRVRLPRESLEEGQANCIDATLLFASLLEGISLNPAIIVVPKHVFLGWETGQSTDQWQYLETTMIQDHSFDEALDAGNRKAAVYSKQGEATGNEEWFRRLSLRDLRTQHAITPME